MKNGWEIRRFGDVCEYEKESGEWKNLPYVGLKDIESNSGRFLGTTSPLTVKSMTFRFTSDHVLYGRLRPYLNKVLLPDFEGHCSTEIFPIRTCDELDRRYLFHWLRSDEIVAKINATWTGARMPRANMNQVLDFPIPVPPIEEQRRIVAILDEAFACIDKAKANTEKNIQNARELFDSYLNNIFSNPAPDWQSKRIKDIGVVQTGTTPKTAEPENYGDFIPFIKPSDVNYSGVGDIRYDNEGLSKLGLSNGRLIKANSVLMVCIGATIGKVGIADRQVSCNQQINAVTPNGTVEPRLVYYGMTSTAFQSIVLREGSGAQATLPIINKSKWENLSLAFPISKDVQRNVVSKLVSIGEKMAELEDTYRSRLSKLDDARKSILQKSFSGEIG